MSETTVDEDKDKELVRFRRWIAMTPDGKWREYRGTCDTVSVGDGHDLVDLVDKMMWARIQHFSQMLRGWRTMHTNLTPSNAGRIFSEMMASIESLEKFERDNFSDINSWTAPKDRSAFPRYLSDLPVLDGTTEPQPALSEDELKLKEIFGDFVPKILKKVLEELRQESQQNGQKLLALGGPNESTIQNKTTQTVTDVAPVLPNPPSHQPKRTCFGVGVSFDENGQYRITGMNTVFPELAPVTETPVAPQNVPVSSLAVSRQGPSLKDQLFAVLVAPNEHGGVTSVGYTPVYLPPITSENIFIPMSAVEAQPDVPNRKKRNRHPRGTPGALRPQPVTPSSSTPISGQSDSGFSTTSDQCNTSSRSSSPAVTPSETETPKAEVPIKSDMTTEESFENKNDFVNVEAVETTSCSNATVPPAIKRLIPKEDEKQLPVLAIVPLASYASIVAKQTNSIPTLPPDRATTSSVTSVSSLHVVMEDNLVEEGSDQHETSMTLSEESDVENANLKVDTSDDEWVVVKTKNAIPPIQPEPVLVETPILSAAPQVVQQEGPSSLSEIANSWDDFEVDEEKEREMERRRLKKQKQRAARSQRQKEMRRLRVEEAINSESSSSSSAEPVENEDERVQEATSEPRVKATVSSIMDYIIRDAVAEFQNTQAIEKAEMERRAAENAPADPYSTGKYSDGDIIKEEEEDERNYRTLEPKHLYFKEATNHAKLAFRILWFDNKKKLEKLRITDNQRKDIQSRIDKIRIMRDRVDMAGRFVVYRTSRPKITPVMEENIINVANNLVDLERHNIDSDMEMARSMRDIIGNLSKKFTYKNYVYSILCLPLDLIPKLRSGDSRIRAYKHMEILLRLYMKRVEECYEDLCDLYEFNIVKVKANRNSRT
ncbi:hypothetical protein CRE_05983 [Caenorhabditis remanei]|uniref:Uncharacterized protein n=1 Tax=Caenorhabditis remanei TaxID=31234 RepID=E3MZD5_CAERE|nr:hypothetical protein CRE_05983 [Caenorhabditis remanei]